METYRIRPVLCKKGAVCVVYNDMNTSKYFILIVYMKNCHDDFVTPIPILLRLIGQGSQIRWIGSQTKLEFFYQFIEDPHPNYGVFIKVAVSLDFFILFCYLLTKPTLAPD